MPELPEVEVVRLGLAPAVAGAKVTGVEVFDARSLKRHISLAEKSAGEISAGHGRTLDADTQKTRATDFARRLLGVDLCMPARRGKFMWIPIAGRDEALFGHLAMSGQMLLRAPGAPDDKHVRIRIWLDTANAGEVRLDFADQRRFGSLAIDDLIPVADSFPAGRGTDNPLIPRQAAHIARDLLDPHFDFVAVAKLLKTKNRPIKPLLLDQEIGSGIGNIYADEALWEAGIHPETQASRVAQSRLLELLKSAAAVMERALLEGGTSFDAQYVNVNGESGYFSRSLNAYGRAGEACHRCGTIMRGIQVGGRASTFCPTCQKKR